MPELKLKSADIADHVGIAPPSFPKYTTQLMNLANGNAGGTRPRVVGQMTELVEEFPGHTLEEWEEWYGDQRPEAIDAAVDKVCAMLDRMRTAFDQIDRPMVRRWIEDLVLTKTYLGLRLQDAILRAVAERVGQPLRPATVADEAKGIDGFIGGRAVSVKPWSYRTMSQLSEQIDAALIFYKKERGAIRVEYDL